MSEPSENGVESGPGAGGLPCAVRNPLLAPTVRAARRVRKLTQAELGRAVGCSQSAVSLFESGQLDALSPEKVQAICACLEIDLAGVPRPAPGPGGSSGVTVVKVCPHAECPSNLPYMAVGEIHFMPRAVMAPASERTHCGMCGEVLNDRCASAGCAGELGAKRAFCAFCGDPYVCVPPALASAAGSGDYVRRRHDEIERLDQALARVRAG